VVRNPYTGGRFFEHFFAPEITPLRYRTVENIGSGFVINTSGMILTNYHVVNNASKLYVNFPDGRRIEGKIVGADDKADLAVISVPGSGFQPVMFGNSDRCMSGEWSIALGNPFLNFINDAHPTVTLGVISALNRNFAPSEGIYYRGMIQTDAAINPGNSGGPLVNARGEVIGINSFIYTGNTASTGSVGIGFAIPINRARRVADELITYGRRRQVWTGISVQNVNRAIAASLNLGSSEGVVIASVKSKSPSEAAGLKIGDIIRKMAGRDIKHNADLDGFFLDYYVGDTIDVQLIRNGKYMTTKIILEEYSDKGRK
jgi:serine protease Do